MCTAINKRIFTNFIPVGKCSNNYVPISNYFRRFNYYYLVNII